MRKGRIEVITGPMYSGKSEELIKRIKIYGYAGLRILIIKPTIDTRWEEKEIISRAGSKIETQTAKSAYDLFKMLNSNEKKNGKLYDVVAIDEAQFFDEGIVDVVTILANKGKIVIISALDTDFRMKPFGAVPNLLAVAEKVDKLLAVCMQCGEFATTTFRVKGGDEVVQVGNHEYEARCRECHLKGNMGATDEIMIRLKEAETK